jgi:2-oxoglutarate ferredoxin oxidoreductase subunit delta
MAEATAAETAKEKEKARLKRRLPRGRVTVFPNWCKGCGLCVEFCPADVLEQGPDGRVTVAHPEKCTACRWCELHCPDFAIFVADVEPEEGTEAE